MHLLTRAMQTNSGKARFNRGLIGGYCGNVHAHTTERERKRNFTKQALRLTDVTALTDSYNVIHTE